jgi:hypothetical protein
MDLRASIPEGVHPAGAATIDHWIVDAIAAVDASNFAEADRLEKMIHDKVEQERAWHREKLNSKVPPELIELLSEMIRRAWGGTRPPWDQDRP